MVIRQQSDSRTATRSATRSIACSYDRRRPLARHVFLLLCLAFLAVSVFALSLPDSATAVTDAAPQSGAAKPGELRLTISGQFRDFTTGQAIGGARVTILEQDGTSAGTALAGSEGEFALSVDTVAGTELTAVYEAAGYLREESVLLAAAEAQLTLSPLLTPQGVKEAVLYSLPRSGVVRQPVGAGSTVESARYGLAATTLTPPATIRVYRNSLDIVQVVDFKFYVKHVLPCEWLTQWPVESLRAGAVAVKEYAWYYIARGGKYPSLGADVTDGTADQWYDPTAPIPAPTPPWTTPGAAICSRMMLSSFSSTVGTPASMPPTAVRSSPPACRSGAPTTWLVTRVGPGSR